MRGAGVLLDHVPGAELVFEPVASAASASESSCVDHPVVGQGGGGDAVLTCGFAERGEHDRPGDSPVGRDVQGVAGAVVEPSDDLHVSAGSAVRTGEAVVGEVGLPGLVRHRCLEADVGGLGSLLRLRGHKSSAGQVTADGGPGHDGVVVVLQVPGDRVRPGVEACGAELHTQVRDELKSPPAQGHRVRTSADGISVRRRPRPRRCSGRSAWRPSLWRRRTS